MRTTIDIDEDVLAAAKELARREKVSAGKVVSRLLREALSGTAQDIASGERTVGGFRAFARRGAIVTNEKVDALRDEEGV